MQSLKSPRLVKSCTCDIWRRAPATFSTLLTLVTTCNWTRRLFPSLLPSPGTLGVPFPPLKYPPENYSLQIRSKLAQGQRIRSILILTERCLNVHVALYVNILIAASPAGGSVHPGGKLRSGLALLPARGVVYFMQLCVLHNEPFHRTTFRVRIFKFEQKLRAVQWHVWEGGDK